MWEKPFNGENEPPTPLKVTLSRKKSARKEAKKLHTGSRSVTDPGSRIFVKGNHKRHFIYEFHTLCDKHGFILETWLSTELVMAVWCLMRSMAV